jgi:hypothetical protein
MDVKLVNILQLYNLTKYNILTKLESFIVHYNSRKKSEMVAFYMQCRIFNDSFVIDIIKQKKLET